MGKSALRHIILYFYTNNLWYQPDLGHGRHVESWGVQVRITSILFNNLIKGGPPVFYFLFLFVDDPDILSQANPRD